MTLDALLAPAISLALAHPYLTFFALLGALILYAKFIYPGGYKQ
jgi:hypothetical protein